MVRLFFSYLCGAVGQQGQLLILTRDRSNSAWLVWKAWYWVPSPDYYWQRRQAQCHDSHTLSLRDQNPGFNVGNWFTETTKQHCAGKTEYGQAISAHRPPVYHPSTTGHGIFQSSFNTFRDHRNIPRFTFHLLPCCSLGDILCLLFILCRLALSG